MEIRSPERVLEELYRTGQRWMEARTGERAHGHSADWGEGDSPPAYVEEKAEDRAAGAAVELRRRFDELVDEFVHAVERR